MVEIAGQAGSLTPASPDAETPVLMIQFFGERLSDAMIEAAAQILEASAFCEMSPTIAEGLAQEMLLASLFAEYDRQRNT